MKRVIFISLFICCIVLILAGCNSNEGKNRMKKVNSEEINNSQIKGQFSREIFSGNTFEFNTIHDTTTFVFNSDSTFVVLFTNGDTSKGIFEVYNGLSISARANEIANDPNIPNAEMLANDIKNVSTAMMPNMADMLNTYLLWLETEDNILQPFLIKYDPNTKTGIAVNIFARSQGSFTKLN